MRNNGLSDAGNRGIIVKNRQKWHISGVLSYCQLKSIEVTIAIDIRKATLN